MTRIHGSKPWQVHCLFGSLWTVSEVHSYRNYSVLTWRHAMENTQGKGHCPMNNSVTAQPTHKRLSAYEWQPASHEPSPQEKSALVNMQISLLFQSLYLACRGICSTGVMMPCSVKREGVTRVPTTSTWPCLEWRDNSCHHSKSKCSRSISSCGCFHFPHPSYSKLTLLCKANFLTVLPCRPCQGFFHLNYDWSFHLVPLRTKKKKKRFVSIVFLRS